MIKTVDCSQLQHGCPTNFKITSENQDELVRATQVHSREVHNMEMSREEVMDILNKTR